MAGGDGENLDTDVLLGFSGKVGIIGRWDFCDIRQNRGLKGVGGMHLYRVDTVLPVHLPTPLLFQPFLVYGFRK